MALKFNRAKLIEAANAKLAEAEVKLEEARKAGDNSQSEYEKAITRYFEQYKRYIEEMAARVDLALKNSNKREALNTFNNGERVHYSPNIPYATNYRTEVQQFEDQVTKIKSFIKQLEMLDGDSVSLSNSSNSGLEWFIRSL